MNKIKNMIELMNFIIFRELQQRNMHILDKITLKGLFMIFGANDEISS